MSNRSNRSRTAVALLTSAVVAAGLLAAAPAEAGSDALKLLMKKMGGATTAGDAKALVPIFEKTKAMAPKDPAYGDWAAIAERGKAAAAKGDLAGAKATCKECHHAYRSDYKAKYGSKAP